MYNDPLPPAPRLPSAAAMREAINPTPGWAARLFGGADPLQGGVLQATDARGLGRNALLNAGLSLLSASGPSLVRHGLLADIGNALQAGQQAYQLGSQQVQQQQQTVAQRLAQSRLAALRARFAGKTDPESLAAYMSALIGEGDYHGASAISEYLKSLGSQDPALSTITGISGRALGLDPNKTYTIQRNRQGEIVGQPLEVTPSVSSDDRMGQASDLFDARQFVQLHADPATRKAVQSFRLFQNHLHEAQQGNQEAYKSLISAFAANADPNNQLRLGMLQFLSNLDPSVQGQARILTQKLESGTIPPEDLARLDALVTGNYNAARTAYQNAYDDQVARSGPGVARHIPRTDEIFGRTGSSGANRVRGLIGGP